MGKTRIIAETGAGQHGVATATVWHYLVYLVLFIWEQPMLSANSQTCFE